MLASVPNEDVIPFGDGFPFHHRHYRRTQFRKLLAECGWKVHGWFGQSDDASEVEPSVNGRTLVVWCEHGEFVPDDGEGRAVKEDVQGDPSLEGEEPPHEGEVAGTADRQPLRDALHEPEDDRAGCSAHVYRNL